MSRGGSRPNSGRRPNSPELKALTGTDRADRQNVAATIDGTAPMIPPLHLSDLAQRHFDGIAEMLRAEGRSNPHFAEHVGLLALRLEQIQMYQAVLEVEGHTFTSESAKKVGSQLVVTRMVRARPEVGMLDSALRHAQSLLGELMLNPAAALRLATPGAAPAGDFDDF